MNGRRMRRGLLSLLAAGLTLGLFRMPVTAEKEPSPAPDSAAAFAAEPLPEITSDYAYLVDADSGQVLYDKNSQAQIYPASMTKLMTLILAIENLPDTSQKILITAEMLAGLNEANASQAGFQEGDLPTVLDLMYGDLLSSGADCSRALAFTIAGSEAGYVEMMNAKAAELGMNDTHFVNTTGLHDDNHYSTCRDIAVLLKYCLQNSLFRQIFASEKYVSTPVLHFPDGLVMESLVLRYVNGAGYGGYSFSIPGLLGGKSGYTNPAEFCLASAADINQMTLILITAHSWTGSTYPSHIQDAADLYSYYRSGYTKQTLYTAGSQLAAVKIRDTLPAETETVAISGDITLDLPSSDNVHVVSNLPESIDAPVRKGDYLGSLDIYSYDKAVYHEDFYAAESHSRSLPAYLYRRTAEFLKANPLAAAGGVLLVLLLVLLKELVKPQRKRRRR
jgi:D-alanyl-D-alanine carboxypeptidase (penicillin-binding protein 5/6)